MKIAIPTNENSIVSGVCQSFGRTPYYLIYDTESKENTFIENTAAKSAGGAGIKAAQIIVDHGVDIVLTPRCGENAAEVISGGKIPMYKTMNASIDDNIKAYLAGSLVLLNDIHPGFHGAEGK
jgi:predicted Fe-Mo cluster-binding NifX family protein